MVAAGTCGAVWKTVTTGPKRVVSTKGVNAVKLSERLDPIAPEEQPPEPATTQSTSSKTDNDKDIHGSDTTKKNVFAYDH